MGSSFWEGEGENRPEEVLLQGWGYGRTRTNSFPLRMFEDPLKAKVLIDQLCPTLCNPTNYSLPGSSVHGILQAKILEWVAIAKAEKPSFSPSLSLHDSSALDTCSSTLWKAGLSRTGLKINQPGAFTAHLPPPPLQLICLSVPTVDLWGPS